MEKRLAAVLAADVAGYSALIDQDSHASDHALVYVDLPGL